MSCNLMRFVVLCFVRFRVALADMLLVQNSPNTERFVYLIDESTNYAQTEGWAVSVSLFLFVLIALLLFVDCCPCVVQSEMKAVSGIGSQLRSFATVCLAVCLHIHTRNCC